MIIFNLRHCLFESCSIYSPTYAISGGALYFYSGDGTFSSNDICGCNCYSVTGDHFCTIENINESVEINETSVTLCSRSPSYGGATASFYDYIVVNYWNSSFNYPQITPAFSFNFNRKISLAVFNYLTIANNKAGNDYIISSIISKGSIYKSNFYNNTSPNIFFNLFDPEQLVLTNFSFVENQYKVLSPFPINITNSTFDIILNKTNTDYFVNVIDDVHSTLPLREIKNCDSSSYILQFKEGTNKLLIILLTTCIAVALVIVVIAIIAFKKNSKVKKFESKLLLEKLVDNDFG